MTIESPEMLDEKDFLEHVGVKGMKWGRRKGETANPAHVSADAARYNKINSRLKSKGLDNLSNDDLAKLNKRNQLMSEYKKANPGKLKAGAEGTKKALGVLKTVGAVVATGAALAGGVAAVRASPNAAAGAAAVIKVLAGFK